MIGPISNMLQARQAILKMDRDKAADSALDAVDVALTSLERFVSGLFSIVNWGYLKTEADEWITTEDSEDVPMERGDSIEQVYSVTSSYLTEDGEFVLTEENEGTIVEYNAGMGMSEMDAIPVDDVLL